MILGYTITTRVLEEHGSRRKTCDLFNPLNARTHSAVFPVKSGKALEPTIVVCNITSNFPVCNSPRGWVPIITVDIVLSATSSKIWCLMLMAPVFLDLSRKLWKLTPMTPDVINRHDTRLVSAWVDAVTTLLVLNKRSRSHLRSFVSHGLYWSHTEFYSDICIGKAGRAFNMFLHFMTLWPWPLTVWRTVYKKYVLWIAGICPIAEVVRNTTFDDDIKTHDRY